MNCCDEYGNCNQGRDCPIRRALSPARRIKPYPEVPTDVIEPPEPAWTSMAERVGIAVRTVIALIIAGAAVSVIAWCMP